MTKSADRAFSYIGHFFDHHTKYNVLFPLKTREPVYVAKKLCRHVFGHFGLPRIIYSNMTREYIDDLTHWIIHFWSTDVPIINGDPDNKKLLPLIQQRQKTVMILIETIRSKQGNSNNWSSWLPGIQCECFCTLNIGFLLPVITYNPINPYENFYWRSHTIRCKCFILPENRSSQMS